MWNRIFLLLLISLPGATGCLAPTTQHEEEVKRLTEAHERYLRSFHLAQADFHRANPMPVKLDLADRGTVLLSECSLEGRPGTEHLWVRFTWVNTTGHGLESVAVTLTLLDEATGTEWSEKIDLKLPFGLGLGAESSYTTSFRTPLRGLYLKEDWSWSLEVTTEPAGTTRSD